MGSKGELAICGFGMDMNQITLETVEILMKAEIVFSDALEEPQKKIVAGWCGDVRDLNELAGPGQHRDVAPRKVELVLNAVADGKRVAVLNYGHATFLSSLAQGLIDSCKVHGYRYRVVNAVSSLGAVLASLELTGLWNGLHVYDADDYSGLIAVITLEPKVPTIIVKVGYLLKPEQRERLRPFIDRLLKFYPPGHPAVLIESPWISNKQGLRVETTIEELGTAIKNPHEFLTLYLPPTGNVSRFVASGADSEMVMPADIEPGMRLADAGDLDGSEAHFSALLEKQPERMEVRAWRARVRLTAGRCEEALRDLDAVIARAPEPGWPHQLRAEARLLAGDIDGCLEDVERAKLWNGHGEKMDVFIAAVHLVRGDYEAAEAALVRSVETQGVDWAMRSFWAFGEEIVLKDHERLSKFVHGRLNGRGDREWMALLLGNWARDDERFAEAIEFYERAIRAYPDAELPREQLELTKAEAARA